MRVGVELGEGFTVALGLAVVLGVEVALTAGLDVAAFVGSSYFLPPVVTVI